MTYAVASLIQITTDPFEMPVSETVRFSMYRRLSGLYPERPLRKGYNAIPFDSSLIPAVSAITRMAFINSPETELYPDLGSRKGCNRLVNELVRVPGFQPDSSWLITWYSEPVGVIIANRSPGCVFGRIQMVAVVPRHRRKGLGHHLVSKALWAFSNNNVPHATAHINRINHSAVRFFRVLGFQVSSEGIYG